MKLTLTRRLFLKAAAAGALLLGGLSLPGAHGEASEELPDGRIRFYNTHTRERLEVSYRDRKGEYDPEALGRIDRLLRCHHTGKTARIDTSLIEIVNAVDKRLGGGNEIQVISGYRSPEYNELLLSLGRGVAKGSLHLLGRAIDIRIPGVELSCIRETALEMRVGGVGYYPGQFVHLDTGRFRSW